MIEFDYKIVRDEGDEEKTYTPVIAKQLQDLVSIEGPNSSGKSTLLHMLALGLYGLKNKNINDSLHRKLEDLTSSDHQKVTFSFSIMNDQNKLLIHSEKKNPLSPDITLYETRDGKRTYLSAESFERKYNLIYDIPDDPLERVYELTRELRDRQADVGENLGKLKIELRNIIAEVESSRDPKKLAAFRSELKEITKMIGFLESSKDNFEKDRRLLTQYYASKYFLEYQEEMQTAVARLEFLKRTRVIREKKEKVIKKKQQNLLNETNNLFEAIRTDFQELRVSLKGMNIKTKEDHLGVWSSLNLRKVFLEPEKHKILFKGIEAFRNSIRQLDNSIASDGKLEEANMLAELIELLQHYSRMKTTLPGTDQSIPEFIVGLQRRFAECKDVKTRHEKYVQILAQLDNLESQSRILVQVNLPELRATLDDSVAGDDDQEDDVQREMTQLNQTINEVKKKIEYFQAEMIKNDVKEKDAALTVSEIESMKHYRLYSNYGELELEKKLKDLQDEIESLSKRIKENEYIKSRHEHEIQRLEQQEPHKYQQRVGELQKIFAKVQILEQKVLREYDENLKQLMEKRVTRTGLNLNQRGYFNAVAVYLGRKVGSIRHIDKEYKVDKIDLVDRKVFTQSGKTIVLTDLGTGQSQSTYLRGLLSSSDPRPVIALIDEVAMMDSQSMKPIYEILRRKYKDGSLLAGIVVQKGESLIVKGIP